MGLQALPRALATVVVPDLFHPSSFAQLERCQLSVLGTLCADRRALLVPHPAAFLGLLLHHARQEFIQGRWGATREARPAAAAILDRAVEDMDATLGADPVTAPLAPLRVSVGRQAWKSRIKAFEIWSGRTAFVARGGSPRRLELDSSYAPVESDETAELRLGAEQTLSDRRLRLRGRPDWSKKIDDKLIEVGEYKSGCIEDGDGNLLDDHVVQVRLYALMLECAFPGSKVKPYLEKSDRTEVPWGYKERAQLLARLEDAGRRLPPQARLEATGLASPGVHCARCRIRPMCPAYRSEVPDWWPDDRNSPRPLPMDVWGEVIGVAEHGDLTGVKLVDAAGRRVRIEGIDSRHGVSRAIHGDHMWFFDLQSSEDLCQHGLEIHPRNFHEIPPGSRWRRAYRSRVFIERRRRSE